MIRTSLTALAVGLLLTSIVVAQVKKDAAPVQDKNVTPAAHETKANAPWFDMEHCPMCKCLSSQKGLMERIKWETHMIDNGMLAFTMIPTDKKEAMAKCKKDMKATAEKLKSGEKMELCGFCNSYGALIQAGAKETEIETGAGVISMLTSDKPEIVKKIQEHAKQTIKEYEAMLASQNKSSK